MLKKIALLLILIPAQSILAMGKPLEPLFEVVQSGIFKKTGSLPSFLLTTNTPELLSKVLSGLAAKFENNPLRVITPGLKATPNGEVVVAVTQETFDPPQEKIRFGRKNLIKFQTVETAFRLSPETLKFSEPSTQSPQLNQPIILDTLLQIACTPAKEVHEITFQDLHYLGLILAMLPRKTRNEQSIPFGIGSIMANEKRTDFFVQGMYLDDPKRTLIHGKACVMHFQTAPTALALAHIAEYTPSAPGSEIHKPFGPHHARFQLGDDAEYSLSFNQSEPTATLTKKAEAKHLQAPEAHETL